MYAKFGANVQFEKRCHSYIDISFEAINIIHPNSERCKTVASMKLFTFSESISKNSPLNYPSFVRASLTNATIA